MQLHLVCRMSRQPHSPLSQRRWAALVYGTIPSAWHAGGEETGGSALEGVMTPGDLLARREESGL